MYQKFFKPLIDFVAGLMAFTLLLPIFMVVAIALTIINRGSPFFTQKRPGKGARMFRVVKFKTMNDKTDEQGNLLPDTERLTKVGRFLRMTSIDELPQLINVLKGDMSLVGPRPLLPEYLPCYTERERMRHDVRPGITGLAQVSGRNSTPWDERLQYDVEYVENLSFKNDVLILFKTIVAVFASEGVAIDPRSTNMKDLHHER